MVIVVVLVLMIVYCSLWFVIRCASLFCCYVSSVFVVVVACRLLSFGCLVVWLFVFGGCVLLVVCLLLSIVVLACVLAVSCCGAWLNVVCRWLLFCLLLCIG